MHTDVIKDWGAGGGDRNFCRPLSRLRVHSFAFYGPWRPKAREQLFEFHCGGSLRRLLCLGVVVCVFVTIHAQKIQTD